MKGLGTISIGVRLPIVTYNQIGLGNMIFDSLVNASENSGIKIEDKDIICITESIVARSNKNYVSVDDIADDIRYKFGNNAEIILLYPIYSRNRFSMILKGIARAASKIHLFINNGKDEVGNDLVNPFTGIDIEKFYKEVIENENCECHIYKKELELKKLWMQGYTNMINCKCHPTYDEKVKYTPKEFRHKYYTLADICSTKTDAHGYNEEYGVLGSNKATEESLKLFPTKESCVKLCNSLRSFIYNKYGVDVEVMVYGDGCFKDPVGGIWEWADPVVSPYYTPGLEGTPNELKIKYVADNESSDDDFIIERIKHKDKDLKGKMLSEGTTPRRYCDLIGSLADLTSGSGDKGTPVVWVKNYFKNYSED